MSKKLSLCRICTKCTLTLKYCSLSLISAMKPTFICERDICFYCARIRSACLLGTYSPFELSVLSATTLHFCKTLATVAVWISSCFEIDSQQPYWAVCILPLLLRQFSVFPLSMFNVGHIIIPNINIHKYIYFLFLVETSWMSSVTAKNRVQVFRPKHKYKNVKAY